MNRLCYLGSVVAVCFIPMYSPTADAAVVLTGDNNITTFAGPISNGDWNIANIGIAGLDGFGQVSISGGDDVTAFRANVGSAAGVDGTIIVQDTDSSFGANLLAIGANGAGTMRVQDGASGLAANLWLGVFANSEANLTIENGSSFSANLISQGTESKSAIYVNDNSTFNVSTDNWSAGNGFKHTTVSLNLNNGSTLEAKDVSFSPWANTTIGLQTESRMKVDELTLSAHTSLDLANRSNLRASRIILANREASATSARTRNIRLRNRSYIASYGFSLRGQSNITIDDSQLLTYSLSNSISIRAGESDLDSELNIINGGSMESGSHLYLSGHDDTSTGSYTVRIQGNGSLLKSLRDVILGLHGGNNFNTYLEGGIVRAGDDLILRNGATFTHNGGSLQVDNIIIQEDSAYNFNFGHIFLRGDTNLFSSHVLIDKVLTNSTIYANQEIEFGGDLNVYSPLVVRGGTLAAGQIFNPSALYLQSGVIRQGSPLTSDTMLNILKGSQLNSGMTFESGQQMDIFINHLIDMNGGTLAAPQGIVNSGTLEGHGNLNGTVANLNVGQIRALDNDTLRINGQLFNEGRIEIVNGHIDASTSPVISSASADIIIRNGIFRSSQLTNDGSLAVTFGTSDIHGDITNQGTGRIIISGNATVTIWDDIQQNSSMHIADGSTLVVFGSYAGAGTTGTGTVFLEGDTRPGFSPGETVFGGDTTLGDNHELVIEIAGTQPGTEHDVFGSLQQLALDGDLLVQWYDGFAASLGDSFDILEWSTFVGSFDNLDFSGAPLALGLHWDTSSLHINGTITVIPEPAALTLVSLGMVMVMTRKR